MRALRAVGIEPYEADVRRLELGMTDAAETMVRSCPPVSSLWRPVDTGRQRCM